MTANWRRPTAFNLFSLLYYHEALVSLSLSGSLVGKAASAQKVFDNVLSPEEIEEVRGKSPQGKSDFFVLPRSLVERLRGGACCLEEQPQVTDGGIAVQARWVSKTTPVHQATTGMNPDPP